MTHRLFILACGASALSMALLAAPTEGSGSSGSGTGKQKPPGGSEPAGAEGAAAVAAAASQTGPLPPAAPPATAEQTEEALRGPNRDRPADRLDAGDLRDRRFLDAETERASAAGFVERGPLPARDVGELARERQDRDTARQEELGRVPPRFAMALPREMVGGRRAPSEEEAERRLFSLSFPVLHDNKLRLAGDRVSLTLLQFGELRAAGSVTGTWSDGD